MSTEENKAVVQRVLELFATGDLELLDSLVAADVVDHNPLPGQPAGREGLKQTYQLIRSAFPDQQLTVEDQTAEGDKVATRWQSRVRQSGPFLGISPTGKEAVVQGINIERVQDGRVVESWSQVDLLGLMQQLGVIPAPGQAPS